MTWSYSGDPGSSTMDEVRFRCGDTDTNDQLITNEEITWALTQFASTQLAAALVLRGLIMKLSRLVNNSVGGVSVSASDMARAFADRVKELDPGGITAGSVSATISFGGLSITEKDNLLDNSDAVQPHFRRDQDDIMPDYDYYEYDPYLRR